MSGDTEQEYFSDGMAEDLITDLSKISNLYVAARNSSFSYKGQMRDVREVAEGLGVSFILEGSVRKMGQRLRINAQLISAADGGHLWAERYDGAMDEIFEFQDRIRGEIIAALKLRLSAFDSERSRRRRTNSVEAYDLFLKGRASYFQYTLESHVAAMEFLEQAIRIDPQFAEAHGNLSYSILTSRLFMWFERGDELERSIALAETGASLDPKSAIVWTRLAWAHGWAGNFDKAVEFYEEALALEPDNAEVHAYYGETLNFTEQAEKSVELLHRALEIEKLSPPSWDFMLGHAHYELGQNDQAVPRFLRCIDRAPMFPAARLYLACTYVELGRLDEAAEQIQTLRDFEPRYTMDAVRERYKYSDQTNGSRFLENLCKAGLPEN
jgi:adenylate cyclase